MPRSPFLVVLGISQDAGIPQAGCRRACCRGALRDHRLRRHAACLAIVDGPRRWLVDVTPDYPAQLEALDRRASGDGLAGIFLTHGHVGHYTGLIHLGREAQGARGVPVWAMPRMAAFLRRHAPWNQLVNLRNIALAPLAAGRAVRLGKRLKVTPVPVPHRSEYTETVGFRIEGPRRSALWIPDIDGWEKLRPALEEQVAGVDIAWLDATFYDARELPGRDIREVPHPRLRETLARLAALPRRERAKIRFIHFNHTNPALRPGTPARRAVERAGMSVAAEGQVALL